MNLLTQKLPTNLVIAGRSYPIYTDFRYWLQINEALIGHTNDDVNALIEEQLFLKECPLITEKSVSEIMEQISWFLRCGEEVQRKEAKKEVFSFTFDSDYIIAAFQEFYQIDLMTIEAMHWWKFNLLLHAMSSDSVLKERVRFRGIKVSKIKDPKQRNQIRKIQKLIKLPNAPLNDLEIGEALW